MNCNNCKHEWDYSGVQEYYCTCPRCHYKVNIRKQEVEDDKQN